MSLSDYRVFYKKGVKTDIVNGKRAVIHSTLYLAIHKDITLPTAIAGIIGENNIKALLSEVGANINEWNRYDTYGVIFDPNELPKDVKEILDSSLRMEIGKHGVIPIVVVDSIEPIEKPLFIGQAPF